MGDAVDRNLRWRNPTTHTRNDMEDTEEHDYEEEEEEEEHQDEDHCTNCAGCEEPIYLGEEVFLVRVVQLEFHPDGRPNVIDVLTPDGDFEYEPAFFCFSCGEDWQEELQQVQEGADPVTHPAGVIACDVCESDILHGERFGVVQVGELLLSERHPNGWDTPSFSPMGDDRHLCIGCLYHLASDHQHPLWPNEVEPIPGRSVCFEGIFDRCWRTGNCACLKS